MSGTAIQNLSDDAYVWVFGLSPRLDDMTAAQVSSRIDLFLKEWAAHGQPITSAREVRDGSFLIIAADSQSERSGCSIDKLFGTLVQLEREHDVKILDPDRVFFRHGDGRVDAMSRAEFREKADAHTIVFDTTVERLGDIRNGKWEKKAEESWHRQLLTLPAIQAGSA
jgi:hypothetical protein